MHPIARWLWRTVVFIPLEHVEPGHINASCRCRHGFSHLPRREPLRLLVGTLKLYTVRNARNPLQIILDRGPEASGRGPSCGIGSVPGFWQGLEVRFYGATKSDF